MKIRPLKQVLDEHPDFDTGWAMTDISLVNPRFGSVTRVVTCRMMAPRCITST